MAVRDEDRAAVLRHRWRADLRALNGDNLGAEMQRLLADRSEAYHAAKDAYLAAGQPATGAAADAYSQALADVELVRGSFRSLVTQAGAAPAASVLNDFVEPSDAELLAGAS